MTLEMACTDLRNFRAKTVGAVFKNVFDKKRPMMALEGAHMRMQGILGFGTQGVCVQRLALGQRLRR